jgi:hypothetical protein
MLAARGMAAAGGATLAAAARCRDALTTIGERKVCCRSVGWAVCAACAEFSKFHKFQPLQTFTSYQKSQPRTGHTRRSHEQNVKEKNFISRRLPVTQRPTLEASHRRQALRVRTPASNKCSSFTNATLDSSALPSPTASLQRQEEWSQVRVRCHLVAQCC